MRIFILLAFNIAIALQISAQTQTMKQWGWQMLDSVTVVCTYQYKHIISTGKTNCMEQVILEIGNNMSKSYSFRSFQEDSLASLPDAKAIRMKRFHEAVRAEHEAPEEERDEVFYNMLPGRWTNFQIYKNYPESRQILVQDIVGKEAFKYTESTPLQTWKLHEDTVEIMGYLCQKATCSWRGRDYTAWFAPDIPINDGPYKFCGLPGLILKIEDDSGNFSFQIESLRDAHNEGIFLAQPLKMEATEYVEGNRIEMLKKEADDCRKIIRKVNRDMQRLGKSKMLSEKNVYLLECDYK